MPNKNIEEILPTEEPEKGQPQEEIKFEGEGEPPKEQPEKIKIGDQEFTVDQIQEALKVAEDYKHLVPEFTRKSQRLAELEKQLEEMNNLQKKIEDPAKAEAKRILKELGFVTIEDAQATVNQAIQQLTEDIQLEQTLQYLENKYSGENGEPPFNRDEVLQYVLDEFGDMEKVDLEYAYKKLHDDFWGKLPLKPQPKVPITERGGRTEFTLPKKKVTFGGEGKGEVSVEEAARELLKQREVFEEE